MLTLHFRGLETPPRAAAPLTLLCAGAACPWPAEVVFIKSESSSQFSPTCKRHSDLNQWGLGLYIPVLVQGRWEGVPVPPQCEQSSALSAARSRRGPRVLTSVKNKPRSRLDMQAPSLTCFLCRWVVGSAPLVQAAQQRLPLHPRRPARVQEPVAGVGPPLQPRSQQDTRGWWLCSPALCRDPV